MGFNFWISVEVQVDLGLRESLGPGWCPSVSPEHQKGWVVFGGHRGGF